MRKFLRSMVRWVCVILSIMLVVGIVFAVYNVIALRDFYVTADREFTHPGTDDTKYDQQGFTVDAKTGLFLYSGYMWDGRPDPIYIVNPDGGEVIKTVRLYNADGSPFRGHAGGIQVGGDYVYIAGSRDECLYVFRRGDIIDAEDGASVTCIGTFATGLSDEDGLRVSFVSGDENRIYVGEFSLPLIPSFRLRSNHRIETEFGTTNALLIGFDIDENAEFGLKKQPSVAYALPDMVQHAVPYDGKFLLSKSVFFAPSKIETAEPVAAGSITFMNTKVPLFALNITDSQYAIPMSEGIAVYRDRIYISTELYNFIVPKIGALWDAKWCYSIPLREKQNSSA